MRIQSIPVNNPNNNTSFGHSFRVNICLKNETGLGDIFVSPASDKKLYRMLNSKIVNWFNEDYLKMLRQIIAKERINKKTEPLTDLPRKMIEELGKIDPDYAKFGYVRSVYNGSRLGYILTGSDAAITENLTRRAVQSGARYYNYNDIAENSGANYLPSFIQKNIREYAQNPNILLRSKYDKEIMLRAVFKETKNAKGEPAYQLDRYEFHENRTKATLPPIKPEFLRYKYQHYATQDEIKTAIKQHVDKILGYKSHFQDFDKILNAKREP